jgi:poly(A) polymerase
MTEKPRRLELALPDAVRPWVDALRARGCPALAVGGVVRDGLRGVASRDWDFATAARPDVLAAILPAHAAVDARLGAAHVEVADGSAVTFTTFREEGDYRDFRHPSRVEFVGSPARDAVRRDFTVNAIYWDPATGAIHDPLGGLRDLDDRRLAAIGDPMVRFGEDPLRMLRAVRFLAQAELEPEPALWRALAGGADLLRHLSAERVFAELTQMWTGRGRGRALRLLVESGLARVVLPEVVPLAGVPQPPEYHPEGDVLTHVCLVLDRVEPVDAVQGWAAVLHDVGKPATFERAADRIRFSGHDTLSATMADAALTRLRAARELRETVTEICREHIRFAALPAMRPRRREAWLRSPRFMAHLAFHRADCLGSHGDLGVYEAARAWLRELPPAPPPPLCTGTDVLALGVPEGPEVGEILRRVAAEVEALDAVDREAALAILARVVAARSG